MKLSDVGYRYPGRKEYVFEGLNVAVPLGDTVAVVGQSGAGKTTLLQLMAGLIQPTKGSLFLGGSRLRDVAPAARKFALMLQRPPALRGITVLQLLTRAANNHQPRAGTLTVKEALDALELEALKNDDVSELSGGQQQRVHIARSLVWDPNFLLLDEPFSSLDFGNKRRVYPLLRRKQEEQGSSIVMITHDPQEALLLCKTIIVISDGKILASGSGERVAKAPPALQVAEILGGFACNTIPVRIVGAAGGRLKLITPLGEVVGAFEPSASVTVVIDKVYTAVVSWRDLWPLAGGRAANGARPIHESPTIYVSGGSVYYGINVPYAAGSGFLEIRARNITIYDTSTGLLCGTFEVDLGRQV